MLGRETPPSSKCALNFGVRLPSVKQNSSLNVSPIKGLNPYQSKWTIKGWVISKRKMHPYNTPRSFRQVFNLDIIDDEGTEIRVTCFNDTTELHYDKVEVGEFYYVSKGSVRESNTKYNKLNNHLEITLDEASILKRCDHVVPTPDNASWFTPINEIKNYSNNTLIDVIGVVVRFGEISKIRRKDGSEVKRRVVKINDMSTISIDVMLWGVIWEGLGEDLKNMHAFGSLMVLAIVSGCVGYFNGKENKRLSVSLGKGKRKMEEGEPSKEESTQSKKGKKATGVKIQEDKDNQKETEIDLEDIRKDGSEMETDESGGEESWKEEEGGAEDVFDHDNPTHSWEEKMKKDDRDQEQWKKDMEEKAKKLEA
ncbi:replication protein A 70 kDa DNA-binding subunit C-like [Cryptomeria japonica]|uniref:replication protein A 70 kDa DNA-binding subunit C-like n=1 Tax=Cryptomeria japonica TaxID=3369 RepID=UPI0027DA5FF5|nr:replication protein A 70 kDa DNA-binding subunit C-like [Cryptomeria japonica]